MCDKKPVGGMVELETDAEATARIDAAEAVNERFDKFKAAYEAYDEARRELWAVEDAFRKLVVPVAASQSKVVGWVHQPARPDEFAIRNSADIFIKFPNGGRVRIGVVGNRIEIYPINGIEMSLCTMAGLAAGVAFTPNPI